MAWSKDRLDNFTEMHCRKKFTPGSIRLSRRLDKYTKNVKGEYDIIFIEQLFTSTEVHGAPNHTAYIAGLINLIKLKQNHNKIRVAYACRPGRNNSRASIIIQDINNKLKNSDVIMLELDPLEIYGIILRTSIVVAFNSSVRCEALMLSKTVLTCNYTGYANDYVVNNSCDNNVINSEQYDEFERKILGALNKHRENSGIDLYKNNNCIENTGYNASTEIAGIINLHLGL